MAFTRATLQRFLVLASAAIVTHGRRTAAGLLRSTGPVARGHFSGYRRVSSAAHLFGVRYEFCGHAFSVFRQSTNATADISCMRVLDSTDPKKQLGGRVDRHEQIGRATFGLDSFRPFVREALSSPNPEF